LTFISSSPRKQSLTREQLIAEVQRLRAGIREHRDGDHIAGAHSERALLTRSTEAGKRASAAPVRVGRRVNSPPQFGQRLEKRASVHAAQNVHSKEQMRASSLSGGRLRSQHSQFDRN